MPELELEPTDFGKLRALNEEIDRAQKLRRVEQRSLEFMGVASVTIDKSSTIVSTNAAIETLLGYQPEELLGQPLTTIIPEAKRAAHLESFERYQRTKQRSLNWNGADMDALHKDGSEIPVQLRIRSFQVNGDEYLVGIIQKRHDAPPSPLEVVPSQQPVPVTIVDSPVPVTVVEPPDARD